MYSDAPELICLLLQREWSYHVTVATLLSSIIRVVRIYDS